MVAEVSPRSVAARLAAGEALVLLDVREAWELSIATLPGTLHVPMGDIGRRYLELDASLPTVVICRSGQRSLAVGRFLEERGFSQVENLTGGILAWGRELDPTLTAY